MSTTEIQATEQRPPEAATLNEGQYAAFKDIVQFTRGNQDAEAWLLEGFAGTGKSYLLNRLLEYVRSKSPNYRVCYAAPTHAALQVLREGVEDGYKFRDSANPATLRPQPTSFLTIAQLLQKKKQVDAKGRVTYVASPIPGKEPPVTSFDLVVVDEVSMVDTETTLELLRYSGQTFFLFTGDGAQLAPVGLPPNKLLTSSVWRKRHGIGYNRLTEPMRQAKDSAILTLATRIRQDQWEEPDSSKILDHTKGVIYLSGRWASLQVLQKVLLSEEYKANSRYFRVLCYTNAMADRMNKACREIHRGSADLPPVIEGERVLLTQPMIGAQGEVLVPNGAELEIVTPCIESRVTLPLPTLGMIEIGGLMCRAVQRHPDGTRKEMNLTMLDPRDTEAWERWNDVWLKHCKAQRDKIVWARYYAHVETFVQWQFPYAMTVHKSQGGTFSNVMLMYEDMHQMDKYDPMNYLRLMYVAVTRAKQNLYFAFQK